MNPCVVRIGLPVCFTTSGGGNTGLSSAFDVQAHKAPKVIALIDRQSGDITGVGAAGRTTSRACRSAR